MADTYRGVPIHLSYLKNKKKTKKKKITKISLLHICDHITYNSLFRALTMTALFCFNLLYLLYKKNPSPTPNVTYSLHSTTFPCFIPQLSSMYALLSFFSEYIS